MQTALSIVAIVLSVISLGWQAFTWKASGPKPVVEGRITQAKGQPGILEIQINNRGRAACQVTDLLITSTRNSSRMHLATYATPQELALPFQLEARNGVTVQIDASKVANSLHHHNGLSHEYLLRIELGDGTFRTSTGALNFADCLRLEEADATEHVTTMKRIVGSTKPTKPSAAKK
jgi:hypothetical protein